MTAIALHEEDGAEWNVVEGKKAKNMQNEKQPKPQAKKRPKKKRQSKKAKQGTHTDLH